MRNTLIWVAGMALMLLGFTWASSALETRDLRAAPGHPPVLALLQLNGRPTPVPVETVSSYGEVPTRPDPPEGWVAYGPGQRVQWRVVGQEVRVTWVSRDQRVTTVWAMFPGGIAPLRSERLAVGHVLTALLPTALGGTVLRWALRKWASA